MLLGSGFLGAQTARNQIEVDYTHPKTYFVGGVSVEGNQYINQHQILQLSGLNPGSKITVPGEEATGVVKRLVAQRYFEDVSLVVDSLSTSDFLRSQKQ